jgi:glucose/arabinose dehydrogenase
MRVPIRVTTACLGTAAAIVLAASGCGGSDAVTTGTLPPPSPATSTAPATATGTRPTPAPTDQGGVKLSKLGTFSQPVFITQPAGDTEDLFVVEKGGLVKVIHDGEVLDQPFLDISNEVSDGSEQGLLSLAFAKNYMRSGLLYVDYTDTDGNTRVVQFHRSAGDPLQADPSSARLILSQDQPYSNHNGGQIQFGPDGHLYIAFGDGGSEGDPDRTGQDLGTFLGKILRIDPSPKTSSVRPYTIPAGNPFVSRAGARPEIYSYGLRNPWRFSFDSADRAIAIGDVGQDRFEEIDYTTIRQASGANFGWSAFEGNARLNTDQSAPGAVPPAFVYPHDGGCSVVGGYVIRDPRLRTLDGRYIYGDFCSGELRTFLPPDPINPGARASDDRDLGGLKVPALSSFGADTSGRIYAISLSGPVYRIDPG